MIHEVASGRHQQVLGHRSAAFALTVYGHLFSEDLAELAAALDLSRYNRGTGHRTSDVEGNTH